MAAASYFVRVIAGSQTPIKIVRFGTGHLAVHLTVSEAVALAAELLQQANAAALQTTDTDDTDRS